MRVVLIEDNAPRWEVRVRDAAEARDAIDWFCAVADASVFHVRLASPPGRVLVPCAALPPARIAELFPCPADRPVRRNV